MRLCDLVETSEQLSEEHEDVNFQFMDMSTKSPFVLKTGPAVRQVFDIKMLDGEQCTMIVNPRFADLARMSRPKQGVPAFRTDQFRWIRDNEDNLFVVLAYDFFHYQMAKIAKDKGFKISPKLLVLADDAEHHELSGVIVRTPIGSTVQEAMQVVGYHEDDRDETARSFDLKAKHFGNRFLSNPQLMAKYNEILEVGSSKKNNTHVYLYPVNSKALCQRFFECRYNFVMLDKQSEPFRSQALSILNVLKAKLRENPSSIAHIDFHSASANFPTPWVQIHRLMHSLIDKHKEVATQYGLQRSMYDLYAFMKKICGINDQRMEAVLNLYPISVATSKFKDVKTYLRDKDKRQDEIIRLYLSIFPGKASQSGKLTSFKASDANLNTEDVIETMTSWYFNGRVRLRQPSFDDLHAIGMSEKDYDKLVKSIAKVEGIMNELYPILWNMAKGEILVSDF